MLRPTKKNIATILLIVFTASIIIWSITDSKKLAKNHILLNGAYSFTCESGGRGNAGTIFIRFYFYLNDKRITGSRSFKTEHLSLSDCENHLKGRHFPILYYPLNPENNMLLIFPDDFKHYNLSFPDSLGWVKQHTN